MIASGIYKKNANIYYILHQYQKTYTQKTQNPIFHGANGADAIFNNK